jgi:chorismate mutase
MMTETKARDHIKEMRWRIDELDRELVTLLNRRAELVQQIGAAKRSAGIKVSDGPREQDVYRNIQSHNTGPLPEPALRNIYERGIIPEMRKIQEPT